MQEQNLKNHAQYVPMYHVVTFGILVLTLVGAGVNLWKSTGDHQRLYSASLIFVLTVVVVFVFFWARIFALKAQDRAIRAEENLRHFVMTGKLLDSRLTCLQIVALRFSSDAEFVALAQKAAESSMEPKAIKEAIKNWRGDYYRV